MKGTFFSLLAVIFFLATTFYSCEKDNENNDPVDPEPIFENCGTVSDYDGNIYNTIKIGNQCWMRENLKVAHYGNGDPIPTTQTPTISIAGEEIPKYQWIPDGEEANHNTFGRLYTWYTTVDERGLCPEGWHIPSDNEWKTLEISLGMTLDEAEQTGPRGPYIGSMLAGDAALWVNIHSVLVISEYFGLSGFDGFPAGARNSGGNFVSPGYSTYWWTSTANPVTVSDSGSFARRIDYESTKIDRLKAINKFGFSVRCVKN